MALPEPDRYDELNAVINGNIDAPSGLSYNAHLVTRLRELGTARGEREPWGGSSAKRNPSPQ